MIGPCKICVVQAVCNESCDDLVNWLIKVSSHSRYYCKWVADVIREDQSKIILKNGMIKFRGNNDKLLYLYNIKENIDE